MNNTNSTTGNSTTTANVNKTAFSWSVFPVLFGFFAIGFFILRWVQRKTQVISVRRDPSGHWDPVASAYNWAIENPFKKEYEELAGKPGTPPAALGQALMRRAMFNVERAMQIREQKPTLQSLVRNGSIGEDVWARFQIAERALEEDIQELLQEAERVKPGWSQQIFPQAQQLLAMERQKMMMQMEKEQSGDMKRWEEEQKRLEAEEAKRRSAEADKIAQELIRQEEEEAKRKGGNSGKVKRKSK